MVLLACCLSHFTVKKCGPPSHSACHVTPDKLWHVLLLFQKEKLVYMEELHLVISKGLHLHLVFMEEKFCCFRSLWTSSIWGSVDPGDTQCLPAPLWWALCLLSKFYQCQKLGNCNLCLVMRTSCACNKSSSSWVRNFTLCKVISPAHPSFLHHGTFFGVPQKAWFKSLHRA